jgi:hypothetical protein
MAAESQYVQATYSKEAVKKAQKWARINGFLGGALLTTIAALAIYFNRTVPKFNEQVAANVKLTDQVAAWTKYEGAAFSSKPITIKIDDNKEFGIIEIASNQSRNFRGACFIVKYTLQDARMSTPEGEKQMRVMRTLSPEEAARIIPSLVKKDEKDGSFASGCAMLDGVLSLIEMDPNDKQGFHKDFFASARGLVANLRDAKPGTLSKIAPPIPYTISSGDSLEAKESVPELKLPSVPPATKDNSRSMLNLNQMVLSRLERA